MYSGEEHRPRATGGREGQGQLRGQKVEDVGQCSSGEDEHGPRLRCERE